MYNGQYFKVVESSGYCYLQKYVGGFLSAYADAGRTRSFKDALDLACSISGSSVKEIASA